MATRKNLIHRKLLRLATALSNRKWNRCERVYSEEGLAKLNAEIATIEERIRALSGRCRSYAHYEGGIKSKP